MKRVFFIVLVMSLMSGAALSLSASENGMMSTFAETSFSGMNGVMETQYIDDIKSAADFNGIRTEIEPQHNKLAHGMNGVMDVFDPNTDKIISSQTVLVKKEVGLPSVMMEFFYPVNGHKISDSDISKLEQLLQLLKQPQVKSVYLRGFTDPTGSVNYNRILSQKRADDVAQWLIIQGVESKKIQSVGSGIDNDADDFHQARRVELSVILK